MNTRSTSDQCREMGLQAGDTIVGTNHRLWRPIETKLTLLWLGCEVAVFRECHRIARANAEWGRPYETADVTLEGIDWRVEARNAA